MQHKNQTHGKVALPTEDTLTKPSAETTKKGYAVSSANSPSEGSKESHTLCDILVSLADTLSPQHQV
jgi:hypothetical protein